MSPLATGRSRIVRAVCHAGVKERIIIMMRSMACRRLRRGCRDAVSVKCATTTAAREPLLFDLTRCVFPSGPPLEVAGGRCPKFS